MSPNTTQQIELNRSLPCGILIDEAHCHRPTTIAYITLDTTDTVPDEQQYYRLLPVCLQCQAELTEPPTLISEFDQTFTGRPNWEWE